MTRIRDSHASPSCSCFPSRRPASQHQTPHGGGGPVDEDGRGDRQIPLARADRVGEEAEAILEAGFFVGGGVHEVGGAEPAAAAPDPRRRGQARAGDDGACLHDRHAGTRRRGEELQGVRGALERARRRGRRGPAAGAEGKAGGVRGGDSGRRLDAGDAGGHGEGRA